MRIVLIGQAAFGAKVLEALVAKGEEVVAAFTLPDRAKGRPEPVRVAAETHDIAVFQPQTYRSDEVFDQYRQTAPELTVMAFVTPIIPARYLELPTRGTINYHPSLLPRHRGASAINWAVIMGDTKTGLTIFWPDAGIDTGPILLQKEVAIGPEDTTGSLYFNHLFPMGIEALVEAVEQVKNGTAPRLVQDESRATYEPVCDDKVACIDWQSEITRTYNLIRGCDPQPGAHTLYQGRKIRLYGPRLSLQPPSASPGTIIECAADGIAVAAPAGIITISKVRTADGTKMGAGQFVAEFDLKPGASFG